jgi:hypothetical protein
VQQPIAVEMTSTNSQRSSEIDSTENTQESTTSENENYKINKKYMQTPCGHKYHSVCLKKWIDIRLECPTCRQPIPLPEDE